jgi:four helix bundle protein
MEQKATQLSEQLLDYGVEIVRLTTKLEKSAAGRLIANQLIRRGTSTGANYEEACGAQSRADFIHKLQIVLKEIRESLYWLKLAQKSSVLKVLNDPSINNKTAKQHYYKVNNNGKKS